MRRESQAARSSQPHDDAVEWELSEPRGITTYMRGQWHVTFTDRQTGEHLSVTAYADTEAEATREPR